MIMFVKIPLWVGNTVIYQTMGEVDRVNIDDLYVSQNVHNVWATVGKD